MFLCGTMLSDFQNSSISRTVQYKKITKPLLERKRRARINRCLDELKELMVDALEAEGENISKLEKADILELTVRHLHRLHKPRDPIDDAQRFQAGYGRCAAEACQFLLSLPGIDTHVSHNLVRHLGQCASSVLPLSIQVPNQHRSSFSPPLSPLTPAGRQSRIQNLPGTQPATETPAISGLQTLTGTQTVAEVQITQQKEQHSPNLNTFVLSSTPSVQDLSKPITGLLMQVPKDTNSINTRGVLRNVILERQRKQEMRRKDEESDVEIDIEKVDDRDMWRPW